MFRYDLPRDPAAWTGAKGRIHRSVAKRDAHGKPFGDIAICNETECIASGSHDGTLAVRTFDMTGKQVKFRFQNNLL